MSDLENNKLIAEFMGYNSKTGVWDEGIYKGLEDEPIMKNTYETQWDWLMPVINKIGNILDDNNIEELEDWEEQYCSFNEVSLLDFKIENLYESTIEFIKWYNLNNKK